MAKDISNFYFTDDDYNTFHKDNATLNTSVIREQRKKVQEKLLDLKEGYVGLWPGDTKTIYFTSSADVELEYHNKQVFKNNVFTYVNNSAVDMYGTKIRVSKGAMIPIKFEYDAGSAFSQRTTDDLVFIVNGVQIIALTVVANP